MGCPGNTGIDVGFGDKDANSLDSFLLGKKKKNFFLRWYSLVVFASIIGGIIYCIIQ